MNWKLEMRQKQYISRPPLIMTSFSLSPPFSRQTAVTTQIVNCKLNHWTRVRHRIQLLSALPRHEYCIFLFILSEGQKSLWLGRPRRIFPRNFVSSATSYINLFLSAKFPNLINHENMEVSNFFYFLAKSFFHQTFWDKIVRKFLLESVPWCIITSLNVWVNSHPSGVDVTYCPDPGAHETLLAWFLLGGELQVGRKKIVIKWWTSLTRISVKLRWLLQGWKSEKSVEKYFVVRSIILAKEVLFGG